MRHESIDRAWAAHELLETGEAHEKLVLRARRAGRRAAVTWVALAVELQRDWAREETVGDDIEVVLTERLLKT